MNLILNRTTQAVIDALVLSLALWLAFFARFDGDPPFLMFKRLIFVWPYVVVLQYVLMRSLGVHRFSWRHIGLREITRMFAALLMASAILLAVRLVAASVSPAIGHFQYVLIPLGVLAIDFVVAFLGVAGIRILRRIVTERAEMRSRSGSPVERVPTILIGAGQAGVMVAKELAQRPELGIEPVGFLDDDPLKVGSIVHGVPVLGATTELSAMREKGIRTALITIANASGKAIRRIGDLCRECGIEAKIIPGIYEIVGGQVNLSRMRELRIEDLLGREPVELEEGVVSDTLKGRAVLVTGAGGSIGSELCNQVCRFGPSRLILFERAENVLFDAHRALLARYPEIEVIPCVGDVGDADRTAAVFGQYRPEVVFHAAAHKHVPMMEVNPGEAIKNNVLGTKTLADTAHRYAVSAFVMISTDKAVNPTSVMGASKRIAEMYVQSLARTSETRFVTVRFGNVLGSAGSVIPIFKEQIAKGGPVTVTHPEMRRYFMTIPEACQLVLQAGSMGSGGEIFILDMGEPVRIVDLASDLISLSGMTPGEDIDIVFTGVRDGEKLFEELATDSENSDKTHHPKIFVGKRKPPRFEQIDSRLAELARIADSEGGDALKGAMRDLVPEYTPHGTEEMSDVAVPASWPGAIPGTSPGPVRLQTEPV